MAASGLHSSFCANDGFWISFFFSWWLALLTAETNFIVVPTRILLLSRTPVNLALGNNLILCSLIVLCQFSVPYFCWILVDKNYLVVVLFCYQPLCYLVPFGNLEWACKRKWRTKGFYSHANMLKLLPFLVIWLWAIHLWSLMVSSMVHVQTPGFMSQLTKY